MEPGLENMLRVVQDASELCKNYFYQTEIEADLKDDGTPVTVIDKKIESLLVEHITQLFPEDSILGEESGVHTNQGENMWFLDPIDGTDNFIRKIPFFSISVARLGGKEEFFALVHSPINQQIFWSTFGQNVGIGNLTQKPVPKKIYIGTGRGRGQKEKVIDYNLRKDTALRFGRCLGLGSAALELAYVASGAMEGFLSLCLKPYDIAAGLLLCRSAGARISEWKDGVWASVDAVSINDLCTEEGKYLFVSHPAIHDEVLEFWGDLDKFRD